MNHAALGWPGQAAFAQREFFTAFGQRDITGGIHCTGCGDAFGYTLKQCLQTATIFTELVEFLAFTFELAVHFGKRFLAFAMNGFELRTLSIQLGLHNT